MTTVKTSAPSELRFLARHLPRHAAILHRLSQTARTAQTHYQNFRALYLSGTLVVLMLQIRGVEGLVEVPLTEASRISD